MDKVDYNPSAGSGGNSPDLGREDGLVWLSLTFFRNIKVLALGTILGTLLFVLVAFLLPQEYRAEVKLIPSTRLSSGKGLQLPSGLRGASALMGVNLGGQDQDLSQLFGQFVKARPFAEKILRSRFVVGSSDSLTLAAFLDPDFSGQETKLARLAKRFASEVVRVRFDDDSGVITLTANLADAGLAMQVANLSSRELDDYHRMITHDQQERMVAYLDDQLTGAMADLRQAEERLQSFLVENRVLQGNPSLEFEAGRLRRTVEIREEVFLNLSAQLELAKFEYYRNTPSIVVIAQATRPLDPVKPNKPLIVGLGFLISFFLVFFVLIIREGVGRLKIDLEGAAS